MNTVLKQQAYMLFYKLRPANKVQAKGYNLTKTPPKMAAPNGTGQSPQIRLAKPEFKKPVTKKKVKRFHGSDDGESSFVSESLSSVGGTRETVTLDDIKKSKKIDKQLEKFETLPTGTPKFVKMDTHVSLVDTSDKPPPEKSTMDDMEKLAQSFK